MITILEWLLERILVLLTKWALEESRKAHDRMKQDAERGRVNAENIKAFENATTRAEQIRAAQNLLNGDRP